MVAVFIVEDFTPLEERGGCLVTLMCGFVFIVSCVFSYHFGKSLFDGLKNDDLYIKSIIIISYLIMPVILKLRHKKD